MASLDLQREYTHLDPVAQHLLQLGAIHLEPISRTGLVKLSNDAGWISPQGQRLEYKAVRSLIETLVKQSFLEKGKNSRLYVTPDLQDLAVQDATRNGQLDGFARLIQAQSPREEQWNYWNRYPERIGRDQRIAFYQNDVETYQALLNTKPVHHWHPPPPLTSILEPFSADIFSGLDPTLKQLFLSATAYRAVYHAEGDREALDRFITFAESQSTLDEEFIINWLELLVAQGDLAALHRMDHHLDCNYTEVQGCEAFLRGDFDAAETAFDTGLARLRKRTRKRKVALKYFPTVFHICLLLKKNTPTARKQARTLIAAAQYYWSDHTTLVHPLGGALAFQDSPNANPLVYADLYTTHEPPSQWIIGLVWRWCTPEASVPPFFQQLSANQEHYEALGLHWLAAEIAGLLHHSPPKQKIRMTRPQYQRYHATAQAELGTATLINWLVPTPAWQRSLTALTQLVEGSTANTATDTPTSATRLIWELEYHTKGGWMDLRPLMQKRSKNGKWTKGRAVALKRLFGDFNTAEFDFLTEQDKDLCRCIRKDTEYQYYGRYAQDVYQFDYQRAVINLVGHPLVFRLGDRDTPIEIMQQDPRLIVARDQQGDIHLSLTPEPGSSPYAIHQDGPHRLLITTFTKPQQKLHGILAAGLDVPADAAEEVLHAMQALASIVAVHSDIGDSAEAGETIDANAHPHLHLMPYQTGIRAEFFVRPFSDAGPSYRAAEGGETVYAEVDGRTQTARRDLTEERQRRQAVVALCPSLQRQDDPFDDMLGFPTPGEALELLIELQPLSEAGQVVLHWPQGQTFNLAGEASTTQFQVRIRKDRDWFAASGELRVNDQLSIDMMELIKLVEDSPSRFVQLDDGRFLALTDQLRRRIDDLAALGDRRKDKIRFAPIRAAVFEELADLPSTKTDKHWTQAIQRMHEASVLAPEPPSTLQAELRDYQREGHIWLRRLAHWGVGGCLADDMGLGKTVQALAVLLDRATGGPALVIAPTSVGFNWQAELQRFAPTLQPKLFGPGDRDAFFQTLEPHDVVISSYGLLHNEASRFQAVQWHTAILDEAQAIKNMASKRSQAAMGLLADFRLIMTGTPLENHLGELWNLFQFINPGLLGSWEQFQWQFSAPIERDQNRQTRARLRKLIQPFILRRTKTQVLDELPSRTEITLRVQLSTEEATFYETLRQRAVDKLEETDTANAGSQHLKILAELMRLRRACCHPRLIMPETSLHGSKLALFRETIDELLENRHKVLVFSQFVDHLTILREALDDKQVSYQYLDGSTPARERQKRVEAFQAGQGDVFLISLRAGGLGLNLTAADYVIHMDPWWNPAVEDQASDRAHRIGQQRPVTIYRLVTQGTIEEKIVDLHHTKRDLADSLLEGTELSGKLSAQELLALLQAR